MEYIMNRLKNMWCGSEIDGYFLMTDNKNEKSLVLVKNGNNY